MFKQVRVGLVAASLVVVAFAGDAPTGAFASSRTQPEHVSSQNAQRADVQRGATLKASSKQVTEGDRYTLIAAIETPRQALKVTLQKYQAPLYTGDDADWLIVKTIKVNARSKVKFNAVAVDENAEKYRAAVTYKKARPVASKPVTVVVWRWISLSDYDPYYEAQPYAAGFGTTTINGLAYAGWGAFTYSHTGAWESRFTPGRRCTAFRGVLGLGDISADGSSGIITFTAEDTVIYTSPALTPGMSVPVIVPLAKPYRFGIRLTDTTPGGTTGRDDIESWPVIGDPVLLCTGV